MRKVAHQFRQQCGEPYDYLGLIRAIERFDPSLGSAFSSFAITYIRGEMLHYLRDRATMMKIPPRWQDLDQKGKKLRKELTITLGRLPKDQKIAGALGISSQEWSECQLAIQNRLLMSLDGKVHGADSSQTFGDILPDPHSGTQQKLQKLQEDRLELEEAMSQLEEKTKAVIEFVFLRELSRKEAARRIGISPVTW